MICILILWGHGMILWMLSTLFLPAVPLRGVISSIRRGSWMEPMVKFMSNFAGKNNNGGSKSFNHPKNQQIEHDRAVLSQFLRRGQGAPCKDLVQKASASLLMRAQSKHFERHLFAEAAHNRVRSALAEPFTIKIINIMPCTILSQTR